MIELAITRWAAWAPGLESEASWREWAAAPSPLAKEPPAPSATEIPALLRRRCDTLSRALLHVAGACCAEPAPPASPGLAVSSREEANPHSLASRVATVFATRFGPLGAIVENLESLAAGRSPSPMTFSHAVHNTALGLYSIWAKNCAPGSALAAGEGTFAHGWLEGALLLERERTRSVLLVAGDAALPAVLAPLAEAAAHPPHALALLLCAADDAPPSATRLQFGLAPGSDAAEPIAGARQLPDALPAPLQFLRWWLSDDPQRLTLSSDERTWLWNRVTQRIGDVLA